VPLAEDDGLCAAGLRRCHHLLDGPKVFGVVLRPGCRDQLSVIMVINILMTNGHRCPDGVNAR
jgi:hypothetical protein